MAQEGSEGSVANSSSTSNFWELQTNSLSNSWTNVVIPSWHRPPNSNNPNSNSSCEEEISISNSFTNTSNHSGLSDDTSHTHRQLLPPASSNDLTCEPMSENHLWSQVLLGVGSSEDLHNNNQDVGENFLDGLSISSSNKNLRTHQMFEPACDYLKKMDNSWELIPNSPPNFNNLQKQLNSFNGSSLIEHERLSNLSNLVSNWSIALPFPESANNCQITTPSSTTCHDIPMNSIHNHHHHQQYSESHDHHHLSTNNHQMKQNMSNSLSSCDEVIGRIRTSGTTNNNTGFFPCYYGQDIETSHDQTSFLQSSFKSNSLIRNQMGNNDSSVITGVQNNIINNKCYYGSSILDAPWSNNNTKNLSDIISFNGFLNKTLVDTQPSKHCLKPSNSTDATKNGHENTSTSGKGSGRGSGNTSSEGKKKRSEDNSESSTVFKKPKQDNSTGSSAKVQVPKVKVQDRITALQQIVSPFGKTDTASVLQEAIGYIKFLQEQVQLLSNPYVKPNTNKDPWGLLERKDNNNNININRAAGHGDEVKLDLKSRGLCLVPISCTPQVYRENNGSDYWTPTYRGSLYR